MSSSRREGDHRGSHVYRREGLGCRGQVWSRRGVRRGPLHLDRSATEDPLAEVPDFAAAEVDAVVRAAAEAQRRWAALPPARAPATCGSSSRLCAGTPPSWPRSTPSTPVCPTAPCWRTSSSPASTWRSCATWRSTWVGTIPASAGNLHYTLNAPYGVVVRIVPYNHPLFFSASKLGPPLVAGNRVVLKAPDQAPLSALRIGEIATETLPQGVVSVVTGTGPESGRALVQHPLVRRIAFIGSDRVGRTIQQDAAAVGVKNISLELGGKNAMIVFDDVDPVLAAQGALSGMNFGVTAGQSCGSTSRVLLHEAVADEVTALSGKRSRRSRWAIHSTRPSRWDR